MGGCLRGSAVVQTTVAYGLCSSRPRRVSLNRMLSLPPGADGTSARSPWSNVRF